MYYYNTMFWLMYLLVMLIVSPLFVHLFVARGGGCRGLRPRQDEIWPGGTQGRGCRGHRPLTPTPTVFTANFNGPGRLIHYNLSTTLYTILYNIYNNILILLFLFFITFIFILWFFYSVRRHHRDIFCAIAHCNNKLILFLYSDQFFSTPFRAV